MTSSEIIRSALIKSGKSQRELADFMGCTRQNLNIRLRKGTLTYNELDKALSFLGHRIAVVENDGQALRHYGNSSSPRATRTINGKLYDTSKASLVDTTKGTSPGKDVDFEELYVDTDGQMFVVYRIGNGKPIVSTSKRAIEKFRKVTI